jgi:hypothetical protein
MGALAKDQDCESPPILTQPLAILNSAQKTSTSIDLSFSAPVN